MKIFSRALKIISNVIWEKFTEFKTTLRKIVSSQRRIGFRNFYPDKVSIFLLQQPGQPGRWSKFHVRFDRAYREKAYNSNLINHERCISSSIDLRSASIAGNESEGNSLTERGKSKAETAAWLKSNRKYGIELKAVETASITRARNPGYGLGRSWNLFKQTP